MTTYNLTIKQMAEIYENSKMPPLIRSMDWFEGVGYDKKRFKKFFLKRYSKTKTALSESDYDIIVDFVALLSIPSEMNNYFEQFGI